jgi:RimJ/RimL family protein N-acetyltransferase
MSRRAATVPMMVRMLACALLAACHRTTPLPASSSSPLPRIPRDAARFEIDSVTDSTAIFRWREARWMRRGDVAYAVDPMQRDALIAQLRIVSRDSLTATAVVTSQVSGIRLTHMLLVLHPTAPWWRRTPFWTGAGVGAVLGAGAAGLAR